MVYGNYPDLSNVKKILIVKLRHHGDVLLSSPIYTLLKKHLPQAEITAYIYGDTLPMLEGHPAIDHYILQKRGSKKLSEEITRLRQIRKKGFDLAINLTEGDRGALALWASKASLRIGFDPGDSGFFGKKKIYTKLVKSSPYPRHTVEQHLDILRCLGIFPTVEERNLGMHIPTSAYDVIPQGEYIVIHPASRWKFKCTASETFTEVIRKLVARGERVVITAAPDPAEIEMVDEILAPLDRKNIMNLSGQTDLKQLGALIEKAKALICVDSVPLHMASVFKTPVVVLFGPSCDQTWGPWQHPQATVVSQKLPCRPCNLDGCGGSKYSDCLYTIEASEILKAIELYLPEKATV